MDFSLSIADIAILVGSIVIVLAVGMWASRNQDKSARGYFLASGKLPWYIIGAAFVSTSVSSEQIVGTVGKAYDTGMGVANWEWWSLPIYIALIVFFIPMFLRNKITTVPEFLTRRFGPLCGDIYSWVMLLAYIFVFLVPVLYGGSLAFANLTGWSFYLVLWLTIALVAAYSIKGGLSSVMWTDAVQCVMLVGGGLILYFLALDKVPGGWTAMQHAAPARFHLYHPPSDPVAPFLGIILGSFGVFIFYSAANQVMIQRVLGARSIWDGTMGVIFAGFINLIRPLVTCFLGLIVYHWIHIMHMSKPLNLPDLAFPFALRTFAPEWGLRGIILAGFLAAVMSTISALANSTATLFSLDVYHKLINKNADDKRLVLVGRLASIVALVSAGLMAPFVKSVSIFTWFQTGVTYVAMPFATVVLFGLLWKRTNYQSAAFGLIGGFVAVFALDTIFRLVGIKLHWIYIGAIAQVFTALGMVLVAYRFPPPCEEQWKPFQWYPHQVRILNDGIARPRYMSLGLWFAIYAVIWVFLYWRFW